MKENSQQVFERSLKVALTEVFDHYSTTQTDVCPLGDCNTAKWLAEQMTESQSEEMVSSSIGLGGNDFRASVGILTHVETILGLFDGGETCPVDWAGELANQVIGRVKNVLSGYDVKSSMGMPVSVRGIAMGFNFSTTNQQILAVTTTPGRIICVLNTDIDPQLHWRFQNELAAANEGSLSIF